VFKKIKKRVAKSDRPDSFIVQAELLINKHGLQEFYSREDLYRVFAEDRQLFLNDLRADTSNAIDLEIMKRSLVKKASEKRLADEAQRARAAQWKLEQKRKKELEEAAILEAWKAEQRAKEAQLEGGVVEYVSEQISPPPPPVEKPVVNEVDPEERKLASLKLTPAERKERSERNLEIVLKWLSQEPYTTVENMALLLGVTKPGARKILNKMVKDGWLNRDELEWVGVAGKLHLFGVSQHGLNAQKIVHDDEPVYNRVFRRGKTKPINGPHILRLQLARIYLDRVSNPNNDFRKYTLDRELPNFGEKIYKWSKYPDAIIENSHLQFSDSPGRALSIGIELERSGKGQERYREILKNHLRNINDRNSENGLSDRYDIAYYFLRSQRVADNMRASFDKYIDESEHGEETKKLFIFDTYVDLVGRIEALNKERSALRES